MISYSKVLDLYPFIGKNFYEYSHPDRDIIRMRNSNNLNIFCDLHCLHVTCNLYFNTTVKYIIFKKKTGFFSKERTSYKNFYELNFYEDFVIEKTKINSKYKVKAMNENLNLIVTTYTNDSNIYELPGKFEIEKNKKYYDNKEEAAIVIEDFKGNLLKKHFIVNGKEISEFEFEVFKASKNQ